MSNVLLNLIQLGMNKGIHMINMINMAPQWEKALIIMLFILPCPGTMEAFLGIKLIIKQIMKMVKVNKITHA